MVHVPTLAVKDEWTKAAEKEGRSVSVMAFDLVRGGWSAGSSLRVLDRRLEREIAGHRADLRDRVVLPASYLRCHAAGSAWKDAALKGEESSHGVTLPSVT